VASAATGRRGAGSGGSRLLARAVANAGSGHAKAVDADIARLGARRQQLLASKKDYWASQVEILAKEAMPAAQFLHRESRLGLPAESQ